MKTKILLLSLSVLLTFQLAAQQSWQQQRGNIAKKKELAMQYQTATLGISASSRTSNREGEVWNKISGEAIPLGQEVNSIKMADENVIWMASSVFLFGPPSDEVVTISKSLDGGVTWEQLPIPNTTGFFAVDIAAIDANIAYVTLWGPDFLNDLSMDAIYRTTDGGTSWTKVDSYTFFPTYIHFFNQEEGWVLGSDGVFITTSVTSDGGQTWTHAGGSDWIIPEGMSLPPQNENEFVGTFSYAPSSNYEVVDSTIIIGGTGYWISHDRGYTWEALRSPLFDEEGLIHGSVAMKDPQTFMFASNLDVNFSFQPTLAYATTDGGQTWTKSNPIVNPSVINYLPGTDQDFIISGQTLGIADDLGITGTARTSDLENWEIVDGIGLLVSDFTGATQNVGAYANYPGTIEAGIMYKWGPQTLLDYDAVVLRNNDYPLTIVTLNHLGNEVVFEYQLQNTGVNDLEETTFNLEVLLDGAVVTTESEIISVAQGEIQSTFLIFNPTEVGVYQFNITVSQANLGQAFYTDMRFLEVSETTLAKDDGVGEFSFTINPEEEEWTHGYLGTAFNLLTADQLTSFSIQGDAFFSDSTGVFNFLIKAIDENGQAVEGEVYKAGPFAITDAYANDISTIIYQLPEVVDLPAGKYIFAVGQDEPQAAVSFSYDNRSDFDAWFFSEVGFGGEPFPWGNISDGSFPTLMLRPNFQVETSTSTLEQQIAETTPLEIFPVPFKTELNILFEYMEEKEVNIQIFDMSGKQWTNFTTSHHQLINQNLSELPNGLYLMKLKSGLYNRSVKVLKQE